MPSAMGETPEVEVCVAPSRFVQVTVVSTGIVKLSKLKSIISLSRVDPVSTVWKSEQIIPSSGVVSVASNPIVPMDGTGLEIDLVMGGSVTGTSW